MISAIQNAAIGMERASQLVQSASANVAQASSDNRIDLAAQMVNMIVGSRVYGANARVVEASAKMAKILDLVI